MWHQFYCHILSDHSISSVLVAEGLAGYKSIALRGARVDYTPAKLAVNMFRNLAISPIIDSAVHGATVNYIIS